MENIFFVKIYEIKFVRFFQREVVGILRRYYNRVTEGCIMKKIKNKKRQTEKWFYGNFKKKFRNG